MGALASRADGSQVGDRGRLETARAGSLSGLFACWSGLWRAVAIGGGPYNPLWLRGAASLAGKRPS